MSSKSIGSVILFLDPTESPIWSQTSNDSGSYFFLVDASGRIFALNGDEKKCSDILKQYNALSKKSAGLSGFLQAPGYFLSITPVPTYGYRMVSAFDMKVLNQSVVRATFEIILISAVVFSIFLVLMYSIMRNMVNPLEKLSAFLQTKAPSPSGKGYQIPELNGCSEIHTLTRSFQELLSEDERLNASLQKATVNLYETKLEMKQAELDFLRSQINPHFLYNTLESIKDIATEQKVPQVAIIAGALGKLFRYNVKGNAIVSLKSEMDATRAYLSIQEARFPEKLEVIFAVPESVNEIPIIKFLLPPLVENAVLHGLEPKKEKGTLFVGAREEGKTLLITVMDDGVGISENQLKTLHEQLRSMAQSKEFGEYHVGLLNVQHRIVLTYGAEYGITIASSPGRGTKVQMRLPIRPADS